MLKTVRPLLLPLMFGLMALPAMAGDLEQPMKKIGFNYKQAVKADDAATMEKYIKEMKARGAPIIAIGVDGDSELSEIVDVFIPIPESHELVQVLATSVVLQMLAYRTAIALDRDIDKPRNLAKSVTVE